MLPKEDEKKLQELLESLFKDEDGSKSDEVVVLWERGPWPKPFGCCKYSYGSYSD